MTIDTLQMIIKKLLLKRKTAITSPLDSTNMSGILNREALSRSNSIQSIDDDDGFHEDFLEDPIAENNDGHNLVEPFPQEEIPEKEIDEGFDEACLEEDMSENDEDNLEPLFVDLKFPDQSLYPFEVIEWKRPHELVEAPQFIADHPTRFDVIQGNLGNCWLLAAMAVIAEHKDLFGRVVLTNQYFDKDYDGMFHFQFWHFGNWVHVIIDDRLPTVDGRLIYSQIPSNNAFWSVLLEKAYAKLHGGYANLNGGHTVEGLQDFTGGLTCTLSTKSIKSKELLIRLKRELSMGSLYGATIHPQSDEITSSLTKKGLTSEHSYSVTAFRLTKNVNLIKLRDPWGKDRVWNGAWSIGSEEWMSLDQDIKNLLGTPASHDGEFWMSVDDFLENFSQIDVCHLTADIYNEMKNIPNDEEIGCTTALKSLFSKFYRSIQLRNKIFPHGGPYSSGRKRYIEHQEHGEWSTEEGTAGGRHFHDSHHLNPQYRIKIPSLPDGNDNVNVIVALTQKNSRKMRAGEPQNKHIGFYVYKIKTELPLSADFFKNDENSAIAMSTFIDLREISKHLELKSGEYVIIPCTHAPAKAEFLLRVFSYRPVEISKLPIQF